MKQKGVSLETISESNASPPHEGNILSFKKWKTGGRRVVDNILARGAGRPEFVPRMIPYGWLVLHSRQRLLNEIYNVM